jgi:hypothetical protein
MTRKKEQSDELKKLTELMNTEAELNPELAEYFEERNGIPGIYHPLYYSLFHGPAPCIFFFMAN